MGCIQDIGCQVLVTATEPDLIDSTTWTEKKMFHVERGNFKEVV